LESIKWTNFEEPTTNRRALRCRANLLTLFPLIEIAWADGRVSRRESDAIVQIAKTYGLTDDEASMCELLENMTSRPIPEMVERQWQDFRKLLEKLPALDRETIVYTLTVQAQFIAEQSSDNLLALLRGERVSKSETEMLAIVADRLEKAKQAANEAERRKMVETYSGVERMFYIARTKELFGDGGAAENNRTNNIEKIENGSTAKDFDKLIPLVPLVKVAWAEGRITRRERELIFAAASRMGVEPESAAFQRLNDWLELHPTHEFYMESLERLREEFENLPEEERVLRRLDVISDCVNVAEASGGTSRFPAGGARICDEEKAAVRRIARHLNVASGASASSSFKAIAGSVGLVA
jgi:uncharacterized tellurite resistance protein B-like protein